MIPKARDPAKKFARKHLPRLLVTALATLLLALFWWQAVSASLRWSHTSDEIAHITAGYTYNKLGDYRLHSENGILPQRIQGLAPWFMDAHLPENVFFWEKSNVWQIGRDFFYETGNPMETMLLAARALNALLGVGLGLVIFVLARRRYGDMAGLFGLGLYALCPNFIAHSALATSDIAAVLFLTLAPWVFWRHLERRDMPSALLAGLVSGLALVAKFNGVMLGPIYGLLALADIFLRNDASPVVRLRRFAANLGLCCGQVALAMFVIWAFFGFRFAAVAPDGPAFQMFYWDASESIANLGAKGRVLTWMLDLRLLPEAWLHGLINVLRSSQARPAFLAGEYSDQGWLEFFPTLILVKTTPALLTAAVIASMRAARANQTIEIWLDRARFWAPLIATSGVTLAIAILGHLNIGHRHILPVYPALIIAAAGVVRLRPLWLGRLVPAALLISQLISSVAIRPHYLAYFNFMGGGPGRAYRLVTDSSLDWGQALPDLSNWLATNRRLGEQFYLSYFGNAWPPHYGVQPDQWLPGITYALPPARPYQLSPGLYAVSATTLSEAYSDFRGPWKDKWDRVLRDPRLVRDDYATYDRLRFARLCKYLQRRRPDASAGYAILIYRLDAAELDAALHGPVQGW